MARSFFNLLLHHPSISFGQDLPCELVDRSNKLVDHLHERSKLLLALADVLEHANLIDALEHADLVDALLGTLGVAELLLNDSLESRGSPVLANRGCSYHFRQHKKSKLLYLYIRVGNFCLEANLIAVEGFFLIGQNQKIGYMLL